MIKARRSETPRALAATWRHSPLLRRIARASPLLRRRQTAATVAVMPRRGFIKTAPTIRERNDSLIKLGLFEPYGASSTDTRKCKQGCRDNIRALAAKGGTYRASDNRALRRSCGDNLRASEKTALTEGAAATPDSAVIKALTHSYAGAGESYKISVLEGVHAARCVAWTPLIDPPRGVWRVNYPKSPKRFCLFRRRQRHLLSHSSIEAYRSVAAAV